MDRSAVSRTGDTAWRRGADDEHGPPETARPVVVAEGVHKSYHRGPEVVHALRGASFALREGEVVGLLGPSGSGKTTLLNVLCGWEEPDEGSVVWAAATSPDPRLVDLGWTDVAILPQSLGLMEELTIRENLELPTQLAGGKDRTKRVDGLLRYFGLAGLADRSPGEVSLGEQQRTAVARALVLRPRLLLADEPTGHQDEAWARAVLRGLVFAAREGTALLMATHNRGAVPYVRRLLSIRDGVTHEEDPATFAREGPVPGRLAVRPEDTRRTR